MRLVGTWLKTTIPTLEPGGSQGVTEILQLLLRLFGATAFKLELKPSLCSKD